MPYINNGGQTTWVNDNDPRVTQQQPQNTMTMTDRGGAISSPVSNQSQADRYANGVSSWLVGKGKAAGMSDMDFADMVGVRQKQGLTQDNANFAQQYGIDPTNFTHKQSFLQKADPYIAAAGMGALSMGALGGFSAAGAGSGAGGAAPQMSMVPPSASFGQTAAGTTMSSVPSGYAAGGAGFMGAGAGAAEAMSGGGSSGIAGGAGPVGATPPPATGVMSGNATGMGAASSSVAPPAAGGGNLLQNIGQTLNAGSTAKNIATYGPVVWAGMEYSNAKDATEAYQQQLQKAIDSSDPFGPERAKYQQQLDELMRDPSSFLNSPQVQFASDAAARKMASMGYNQSPAQAQAIADASIGQYYEQAKMLAGLTGSNIAPNTGAAVSAANGLIGARTNENASFGNVARTAMDTFFGGTNTQGSWNSNGRTFNSAETGPGSLV